jgi:cbb3-type cytochrome oxidase subunit 1
VLVFIAVPINICQTVGHSVASARGNPPQAFFLFGVLAFCLSGLARVACVLLDSNQSLNFTWFNPGISQLNFYGFFAMAMFGAVYIIMPRLVGLGLPWPGLVRVQLWCSIIGVLLIVLPLVLGGWVQQVKLNDPNQPFVAVMRSSLPFLRISTLGDLLLLAGHLLFLTNLVGLVVGFYRARAVATYDELTEDLFKPAGAKP